MLIDAAVDAEGEAIAGAVDCVCDVRQRACLETDDMQDRPEHFARQLTDILNFKHMRRNEMSLRHAGAGVPRRSALPIVSLFPICCKQRFLRRFVDHRADIGGGIERIGEAQFLHLPGH